MDGGVSGSVFPLFNLDKFPWELPHKYDPCRKPTIFGGKFPEKKKFFGKKTFFSPTENGSRVETSRIRS
jgi:hypothetical protein